MFDFNKPKIQITEMSDDKRYGKFVVEPLERGYGITLGNSLRRIMLSSLPGAAVSQVKIDGVLHEFSSMPGVKEDVTEIIMNLKNLAIKNVSDSNEPKTAYIEFEGEGVVTGADIQVDQDLEILNPEQVIATLNGGTGCKFNAELTITKGRGYVSADKGKSDDMPIGMIAVDAIYTPVERVNMSVENTRVGQVTDFEKLTVEENGEIYADGQYVDRFALVDFENYDYVEAYGENLYRAVDGATQTDAAATVNQGYLEASNINVVTEMVDMISIARDFESNQKIMNTIDEMLGKMVSISEI